MIRRIKERLMTPSLQDENPKKNSFFDFVEERAFYFSSIQPTFDEKTKKAAIGSFFLSFVRPIVSVEFSFVLGEIVIRH